MCVGPFAPKAPQLPAQPALKAPPPPQETPQTEQVKQEGQETGIENRRKLKAEAEKIREGVKQFGAIDESTMTDSPEARVKPPI